MVRSCPAAPLVSIGHGQGGDVPLLIGSNRDEARLFLVAAATIDLIDDTMLGAVAGAYGLSGEGLAVYRANRPQASPGDVVAAVISDWFFRVPPIRVAEARAAAVRAVLASPIYMDVPVRLARACRQPRARRLPWCGDPVRLRHDHAR